MKGCVAGGWRDREAGVADHDAVYALCLATADAGEDASRLFRDGRLLGDLYAGPYLAADSALCVRRVAEDPRGVFGYLFGVADTRAFHRWRSDVWLPRARRGRVRPEGPESDWTLDETLLVSLFDDSPHEPGWLPDFPAHLHLALLPRARGRGWGTAWLAWMLCALSDRGARGAHLTLHPDNARALSFFLKNGFVVLERADLEWEEVLYLGKRLP